MYACEMCLDSNNFLNVTMKNVNEDQINSGVL